MFLVLLCLYFAHILWPLSITGAKASIIFDAELKKLGYPPPELSDNNLEPTVKAVEIILAAFIMN